MKQKLVPGLLLVLFAATSAKALDLTPVVSEYVAEGITFRQLTFKDGKRQVVYEPPQRWTCRGSGSSLQLTPPNAERADAAIQTVESSSPQSFDEKTRTALKEQFVRALPPGSQTIAVINEEQNPVVLENSASYAVTGTYQVIGETFVRSVVFVNLPGTQLTFKFTARKADFENLHKAFRSSILSWHWVDRSAAAELAQKEQPQAATSRQ
jgi:hypothetical protein